MNLKIISWSDIAKITKYNTLMVSNNSPRKQFIKIYIEVSTTRQENITIDNTGTGKTIEEIFAWIREKHKLSQVSNSITFLEKTI